MEDIIAQINLLKEADRLFVQRQRTLSIGLPSTLTLEEWTATIRHFNGRCAYCMIKPYYSLDHIIPLEHGGGTTSENCVPACVSCNSKKGTHLLIETNLGLSLDEKVLRIRNILDGQPRTKQSYKGRHPVYVVTVRFPSDFPLDIRAIAKESNHTLNSEILEAIRFYVEHKKKS